jgi:uncharacterized membrane protein YhhN
MQRSSRGRLSPFWGFVPYVAACAVHVAALAIGSHLAGPTKLWLMPLLALPVLLAASRIRPRATVVLLLAALLFSWLGDSAGALFSADAEIPVMLGFFGLAHLAYIALFARFLRMRPMPWWALVYAVWWVAMLVVIGPHTGGLFIAVAAYGLVLGGTAAFATRCHPLVTTGAVFFLISDSILACRLFLPDVPDWTSPAIMATYTVGQGLIVAGALIAVHRRRTR